MINIYTSDVIIL